MSFSGRIRTWINRDDGRFYQAGNKPLGGLEIVGLLLSVAALLLWQLHDKIGIHGAWAFGSGALGLLLNLWGNAKGRKDPRA